LRAATRFGIDLASHRSHRLLAEDVSWADLILVMQGRHVAEISRRWPQVRDKVRLLGHYLDEPPFGIADPWGRGDKVFAFTFQRIERAVNRLVAQLEGHVDDFTMPN
jgi:protein-tyrosine phosphatase